MSTDGQPDYLSTRRRDSFPCKWDSPRCDQLCYWTSLVETVDPFGTDDLREFGDHRFGRSPVRCEPGGHKSVSLPSLPHRDRPALLP